MPPDERIPCTQHPQMLEWINEIMTKMGKFEAHMETTSENQHEIFEKLSDIKSTLDRRANLAETVDKITIIAQSNSDNIQKLKNIVENGLSDRTKEIAISVKCLEEELEKRQKERELEKARCEAGIGGFFRHSWEDFKSKFGWVLILVIFWLLAWGFVKAFIFHEFPFPNFNAPKVSISLDESTKEK